MARSDDNDQWAPSRDEFRELQNRLSNIENLLLEVRERAAIIPQTRRSDQSRSNETDEEGSVSDQGNPAILARRAFSSNAVYLGGNSVPAMVTALATEQNSDIEVQSLLSKSVLPIFGLDNDSATYPPVMDAVRVPPSACNTSQSIQTVRGPILAKSNAARIERPINR